MERVKFPGIPHPGIIGTAPSMELLNIRNEREIDVEGNGLKSLKLGEVLQSRPLANLPTPRNSHLGKIENGFVEWEKIAREAARTVPERENGGNFDIKNLRRGSKVYLLVFIEGENLNTGDMNFSQADGEVSLCGAIEMSGMNVFLRNSEMLDPPVANLDHLLVFFSLDQPKLESTGIPLTLALNKTELMDKETLDSCKARFQDWGYQPVFCSVKSGLNFDLLAFQLRDDQQVAEVSTSSDRGKHTTKLEDDIKVKLDEEVDNECVLNALKEAFVAVGYSLEPEGPFSFAEVGNPVMALATFLSQLVGSDVAVASTHNYIKSLSGNAPDTEIASRCCYWNDPINSKLFKYVFLAASSSLKSHLLVAYFGAHQRVHLVSKYEFAAKRVFLFILWDPGKIFTTLRTRLIFKGSAFW